MIWYGMGLRTVRNKLITTSTTITNNNKTNTNTTPDSKVQGANMGPIWGRQDSDGPHVGLMNLAIWDLFYYWYFAYVRNLKWVSVDRL